MKLPFLKESKWPAMKETREQIANPSHDTQLQDHLLDEMLMARESKDSRRLHGAMTALIRQLLNEENDAQMAQ
jgi:hypothetical protein